MTAAGTDAKADLHHYLQSARDALLWKLEGLSEYDARRPLTPTGTNLLGLVKHTASVELGYLGDTFGRPSNEPLPWLDADAFSAFTETGDAFNPDMAARLKTHIYAVGGSVDPEDAYKAFRGKLPTPEAMLEKKGLAA